MTTRILATTVKHIRRAPFQALAAISVLSITFFLISVFSLVTAGSEQVIRYFETRPQVTAFFKDEASPEAISGLEASIDQISGVTSTRYLSKADALALYREQNKNDPLLLEMVTADILPASLEVNASNPDVLSRVAELMKQQDIIEEVVYQKTIIDNLVSWTKAIRYAGLGLISFLLTSSIFTVMIIISMKIATKRTEIEVMRLLGASMGQVLAPFLMEGLFYGALGSFVGWGLAYVALLYSTPFILTFLGSIPLLPVPLWFMGAVLGIQLAVGVIVGLISATVAARRFLR